MDLEEKRVSYKIALLLKEKGFDFIDCNGYYHINEGYISGYAFCYSDVNEQLDYQLLSPTLNLVQLWLREVHGIHIQLIIDCWSTREYFYRVHGKDVYIPSSANFLMVEDKVFGEYNYVLEKAIVHCLNMFVNK